MLFLAAALLGANLLNPAAWEPGGGGGVEADREGIAVRSGVVRQLVPIASADGALALTGSIELRASAAGAGAFVEVREYNEELVEVRPAHVETRAERGSSEIAMAIAPAEPTRILGIGLGLNQGNGEAVFRRLSLSGRKSRTEPVEVALWEEPALAGGAALDLAWARGALASGGVGARSIGAAELGDVLIDRSAEIVVLPYGERFPSDLLWPFVCYLARGGSFVTLGGYAFRAPMRFQDGAWRALSDATLRLDPAALRLPNMVPGSAIASARAGVRAPEAQGNAGGSWCADVPGRGGRTYLARARFKVAAIGGGGGGGGGYGFFAVYQYAGDRLVTFRDIVVAREITPWRSIVHRFQAEPATDRLRVTFGVFNGWGEVFCEDVELLDVTALAPPCITTAEGRPGDGLEVPPWRIGIFDADFPLERACRIAPSGEQPIVRATSLDAKGPLKGWAANAVVRPGRSRWIPLLDAFDRFGELRGAAGALVANHRGLHAGSMWAFFGVEDVPLFGTAARGSDADFRRLISFMLRKVFIAELRPANLVVRQGEPPAVKLTVANLGGRAADVALRLSGPSGMQELAAALEPGSRRELALPIAEAGAGAGLARARAELVLNGEVIDRAETAAYALKGSFAPQPPLRFRENYFAFGDRALFLFGADNYANDFDVDAGGPLLWDRLFDRARDLGVQIYEILLPPCEGPEFPASRADLIRAQAELLSERGLVYMPGFLIGRNAAVADAVVAAESSYVRGGAAALAGAPRLIWYLNGDFQFQDAGGAGAADFRRDVGRVERWCSRHVAAIRSADAAMPITSEYYQFPIGPLDLRLTIDGQDLANFGFFDRPSADIEFLPKAIAANDLRSRGKGVGLGEYGAKTHPAWISIEGGDLGYHTARTGLEKERLFAAVHAYALGMGASRVQTWCLRDPDDRVFPWGLVHHGRHVARDAAYLHRGMSLILRALEPVYRPPPAVIISPTRMRLESQSDRALRALYAAAEALLALRVPFEVADDDRIDALAPGVRLAVYPVESAPDDANVADLRRRVEAGGALLVSGDFEVAAERARVRLPVFASDPRVHIFAQKTRSGEALVVCPFRAAGPVRVEFAARELACSVAATWPVVLHVKEETGSIALFAGDGALARRGAAFVETQGFVAALALDAADLAASTALVLFPWRARTIRIASQARWKDPILCGGTFRAGRFEVKDERACDLSGTGIAFDSADPSLVFLLCESGEREAAIAALEQAFYRPEAAPGL